MKDRVTLNEDDLAVNAVLRSGEQHVSKVISKRRYTAKIDISALKESARGLRAQGVQKGSARSILRDLVKRAIDIALEDVFTEGSTDPSTPAAPARGATAPASRRARAPRSA